MRLPQHSYAVVTKLAAPILASANLHDAPSATAWLTHQMNSVTVLEAHFSDPTSA